jgi:hypothetical protein
MTFTPKQLRDMADVYSGSNHAERVAAMLRQAASDAEFRQFWESSGEETTPAPRKPE